MKSNNLCTIYIVRHGETDWNARKKIQGSTDIPLNETGEAQAKELGEKLAHIHFDKVFSSNLQRAKKTAELITLERELAVETTKLIQEKRFGAFEGASVYELDKIHTLMQKLTEEEKLSYKAHVDAESDEEVIGRFITFLREVAVAYPDKTVLVVSHGGTMRALLIHLGIITYDTNVLGLIQNTAYLKLESDGIDFFMKEMSGIKLP